MKKIISSVIVAGALILGAVIVTPDNIKHRATATLGSGASVDKASYDLIGTADSKATVNTTFASSTKTVFSKYMDNLHLDVEFTPNGTDKYLELLIEVSNDGGETFYPLTTKSNGTDEVLSYSEGENGVLVVFPGSKTTTSGNDYKGALDFDIVGDLVKISTRASSGTSTVHIRGTVSSKL